MLENQEPDVTSVSKPAENKGPVSGPAAQQEALSLLVHAIADRVDPVIKLITTIGERYVQAQETKAKYNIRMAWVAVSVITLIVLVASGLTYAGKVDGSTFTFLLGLIVGYVLTFIRDAIRPQGEK